MSWYVARSLDQLLAEINASAPGRNKASDGSIGDADHSSRDSDHNPCDCHDAVCARDFTHDPKGGFDSYAFAHWLAERVKGPESRVKYIISNGRIASGQGQSYPPGQWRPYTGSNPHSQHVHVSVRHGPEHFDNAKGWGWSGDAGHPPTTEPAPPATATIPGEPTMFLSVHSVGLYALVGLVLFEFQNFEEYVQATESSPDIPVMGIGDKVPMGGRQWLVDRLNEQSVRATSG